jgi:hypothetical protein
MLSLYKHTLPVLFKQEILYEYFVNFHHFCAAADFEMPLSCARCLSALCGEYSSMAPILSTLFSVCITFVNGFHVQK